MKYELRLLEYSNEAGSVVIDIRDLFLADGV